MHWPTSVHVLRKGGNSSERMHEMLLTQKIMMQPPRRRKVVGAVTSARARQLWLLRGLEILGRKPRPRMPARRLPFAPMVMWLVLVRRPPVRTTRYTVLLVKISKSAG